MSSEQRAPEVVVARFRSHGRALFWPSLAFILTVGAVAFFAWRVDEQWETLAILGAGLLAVVLLAMLPLLSWLGRNYTITTRRIVLREGLLTRTRQELLHSRGYDVTLRQNALQSMFGSGDIRINTGLEHPVVMRDVPGAVLVQGALHELMEQNQNAVAARRQRDQSQGSTAETAWDR